MAGGEKSRQVFFPTGNKSMAFRVGAGWLRHWGGLTIQINLSLEEESFLPFQNWVSANQLGCQIDAPNLLKRKNWAAKFALAKNADVIIDKFDPIFQISHSRSVFRSILTSYLLLHPLGWSVERTGGRRPDWIPQWDDSVFQTKRGPAN